MTCQSTGRYPTGTIGFGIPSPNSRRRRPCPPQNSTTFMLTPYAPSRGVMDLHPRDRRDEPAAPLRDVRVLADDLVAEVPRKDENVVRLRLADPRGIEDRDAAPGQVRILLCGVPIHGVR